MAPENIVVRLTVVPAVSSTEQVEVGQPDSPKRIADQFLSYLADSKRTLKCRCSQPLDPEPESLGRTCLNCLAESRWRQRADDFYRRTYPEAVVFAEAILEDRSEAEDVVSQTFIDFLDGRVEARFFFRVLKFRCLDSFKRINPAAVSAAGMGNEDAISPLEMASELADRLDHADRGQDPIEVLISRKEYRKLRRLILRAREIAENDRKYRWIKRKEWAKPLNLGRKMA
jgi:DNA-directed RNA polymerase specialized sigma24 family protein